MRERSGGTPDLAPQLRGPHGPQRVGLAGQKVPANRSAPANDSRFRRSDRRKCAENAPQPSRRAMVTHALARATHHRWSFAP